MDLDSIDLNTVTHVLLEDGWHEVEAGSLQMGQVRLFDRGSMIAEHGLPDLWVTFATGGHRQAVPITALRGLRYGDRPNPQVRSLR